MSDSSGNDLPGSQSPPACSRSMNGGTFVSFVSEFLRVFEKNPLDHASDLRGERVVVGSPVPQKSPMEATDKTDKKTVGFLALVRWGEVPLERKMIL